MNEAVDYKELLKKYMHVLWYVEGSTFEDICEDEYTAEQLKELKRLAEEVQND